MFTIKAGMNPATIRSKYGKQKQDDLKESKQRREKLEKLASMSSGEDIIVQLSGSQAYADIATRDDELGYTNRIIINVPVEIPEQEVTSYDDDVWELLFQKTEMYHELGHVLYTDWPSFEDVLFGDGGQWGVEMQHRPMFKDWWNILEDASIEPMLMRRFNIEDDLRVKNENLLKGHEPRPELSMHEAIAMALMEEKHPLGRLSDLLDPANDRFQFIESADRTVFIRHVLPLIDERVDEIKGETDPVERNIKVYELYVDLKPYVDIADVPGEDQRMTFGFPDDGEDRGDESPGMDPGEEDDDDGEIQFIENPSQGIDHDVQVKYEKELPKQDPEESDDDGIEEWLRVVDREYEDGTSMELEVLDDDPDWGSFDDATRVEAERLSKPLSQELEQRLKHQQRSKKQTGKKSGKIDKSALHKTGRGKVNVFQKKTKPDAKDYSCMILVDRSGSMGGSTNMMPDVESASGALAYALEDIGVDVGQIGFSGGDIMLEKDFSESVDDAKRKMFRNVSGGGTPMSDGIALARARLENEDHPFIIVVTDGLPDNRERYRDELHKADFPVLGIYVDEKGQFTEEHMNEFAYFHALETRQYEEALQGARNLTKQVMF